MEKRINLKVVFSLLMHLVIYFIAVLGISHGFLGIADSIKMNLTDYIGLSCFSLTYYIFLWVKLYSHPYHFYLSRALPLTLTFLMIFVSLFLVAEMTATFLIYSPAGFTKTIGFQIVFKYLYFTMSYIFLFAVQYLWIYHLAHLGFFRKNTMVIGSYDERIPVERLFQDVKHTKNYVGQLIQKDQKMLFFAEGSQVSQLIEGTLEDFLLSNKVNELIVCMDDQLETETLHTAVQFCYKYSIGYYLIPDISRLPQRWPWDKRFNTIPTIERFCPNRDSLVMLSVKRILDIILSFSALVVLSPVFAFIAAAIFLKDGSPVIYASNRIGIHGRPIRFYKFRSMVKNAESLKKELLHKNERKDGPLFKMKEDPRVTPFGHFLRKTSLDEIPQFWNVLRGDMGIIGPRPHLPEEVEAYTSTDHLRLECVPGISCLPQIRGRDELGFREWVDLDLEYRKKWSLSFDFKILWQTAGVVLSPLIKSFSRKKNHI